MFNTRTPVAHEISAFVPREGLDTESTTLRLRTVEGGGGGVGGEGYFRNGYSNPQPLGHQFNLLTTRPPKWQANDVRTGCQPVHAAVEKPGDETDPCSGTTKQHREIKMAQQLPRTRVDESVFNISGSSPRLTLPTEDCRTT